MSKRIVPIVLAAVFAVSGALFFSCGPRRFFCAEPEERAEIIVKKMTRDLKLTKEQVQKVNKIKDEILARTKNLRDQKEAVRGEFLALVRSDRLERNKVNAFVTKREEAFRGLKPFFIDKFVEFHNILTPEQRGRLSEKIEKFHNWCRR
ncbi:MAG: Spy/CpxP family protein refolding chaperone [Spirochaetes bacterium]|nr:Spy/CpxP family protein refolding chaperone [Spirochaetota bacterium]